MSKANQHASNNNSGGRPTAKDETEFHTWVIGGHYAKSRLHRNQMRADLDAKSKQENNETCTRKITQKMEDRKLELQTQQERRVPTYVDKVTPALRADRIAGTESGGGAGAKPTSSSSTTNRRKASPPRQQSRERTQSPPQHQTGAPAQPQENQAQVLRQRLQYSFAQTSENEAYGTLFPPLLTPYYRPMNFLRGAETNPDNRRNSSDQMLPISKQPQLFTKAKEPFNVLANRVQRAQPQSGPKCFFPSGSPTAAYRYYTNFNVMARQGEIDSTMFPDLIRQTRVDRQNALAQQQQQEEQQRLQRHQDDHREGQQHSNGGGEAKPASSKKVTSSEVAESAEQTIPKDE